MYLRIYMYIPRYRNMSICQEFCESAIVNNFMYSTELFNCLPMAGFTDQAWRGGGILFNRLFATSPNPSAQTFSIVFVCHPRKFGTGANQVVRVIS